MRFFRVGFQFTFIEASLSSSIPWELIIVGISARVSKCLYQSFYQRGFIA